MFPNESNLESVFTFETGEMPLSEDLPFQLLLIGNWSGNAEKKELSARRTILIDRDNFDEVLQKMNTLLKLDLNGDGNLLSLEFNELDDFHPDNLFRQVPLFAELREIRRRLKDSESFDEAARQVRAWFNFPEETSETTDNPTGASPISSENLLDDILSANRSSVSANPQNIDNSELGIFISKIVSPHLVKIDESEQSKLTAAVDEATSNLMRAILHNPQFQELESAWRGLYFLVRRLETDVDLKIYIFDISKKELAEDLKSAENLAETVLYQKLIRETIETPGGKPFAVVGGNYTFGLNIEDVAALMRLAKLSTAADAPFTSYIQPQMFGIAHFGETIDSARFKFLEDSNEGKLWAALRSTSEAKYLGLSPMRLLGRMPYGEATDSAETFSFEEFTENPAHENYLWTNPCFALSLLLAQSYRLYGWEMAQALKRDLENLPMHIYQENGESKTKPCAEAVLTENISEILLEQGLIPLISFRDSDYVKIARFQSIASPSSTLGGRWNV